jgi:hypothetical protein
MPAKKDQTNTTSSKVQASPRVNKLGNEVKSTGKPQLESQAAKKTTIDWVFPRASLKKAIDVPKAIKAHNAGNAWTPELVASAIGLAKGSSNFFYIASASQKFGLTEGGRDAKQISLTELGRKLVYPKTPEEESQALRQAFNQVDLFSRVYKYYQGYDLPKAEYLSNTLEREFGLDAATHAEFVEVFTESCQAAGLPRKVDSTEETPPPERVHDEEPQAATIIYGSSTSSLPTCFVIMPFVEKSQEYSKGFFSEVLNSLIIPAGDAAGFKIETARKQGSDVIQATILRELLNSELVLADLTSHNPNVLFELGMRINEDKPVVLIRAEGTPAIFDVDNMMRVFEYNRQLWKSTIETDVPKLTDHIRGAWDRRREKTTYKKILLGQS